MTRCGAFSVPLHIGASCSLDLHTDGAFELEPLNDILNDFLVTGSDCSPHDEISSNLVSDSEASDSLFSSSQDKSVSSAALDNSQGNIRPSKHVKNFHVQEFSSKR